MTNQERRAALECLRWLDDYAWHSKTIIGCAERLRRALMTPRDQMRYDNEVADFLMGKRIAEPSVPPELRPRLDWVKERSLELKEGKI